jgi:hypothetical protein
VKSKIVIIKKDRAELKIFILFKKKEFVRAIIEERYEHCLQKIMIARLVI